MTLRPRRFAHHGVVSAAAFLVSPELAGEAAARARVVALAEGATVHATRGGWLVRLRTPIFVDCASAPGVPLVATAGGVLTSAPLDADELSALHAAPGDVVVASGGFCARLDVGDEVDPADWLDVDAFVLVPAKSLGEVRRAPAVAVKAVEPDARATLGVGAPTASAAAMLESLRQRANVAPSGRGVRSGVGAKALAAFAGALAWIGSRMGARAATPSTSRDLAPARRAGSSPLARLGAALRRTAARILDWTRLATILERAHARYFQRLFDMLDQGDLDAALRHAIPLGGAIAGATAPALLPPSPRGDLTIAPHRRAASSTLGLDGDLYALIRARYRQAFEKLDALGRHKEAAFVLAELLGASEEAVGYLERHQMLRLAAEIAEARDLPVGLIVRQWWIAGERRRAVDLARARGAFADAVFRLEKSDRAEAEALRLVWADSLADGGAYAAAIDVAWPVVAARKLALHWIDRAIEVGGVTGARMLAKKVHLAPDRFADVRPAVLALLEDREPEGAALRLALGTELGSLPSSNEVHVLARATLRALLRDRPRAPAALVERLVASSDDALLRADLARSRKPAAPTERPRGAIRVDVVAKTETGSTRALNEDWVQVAFQGFHPSGAGHQSRTLPDRGVLLALVDGTGTGPDPRACLEPFDRVLRERFSVLATSASTLTALVTALQTALEAAGSAWLARHQVGALRGAGATVVAAAVRGEDVAIAHAGDARAYLLRQGRLRALTRDHSPRRRHARGRGKLTEAEVDDFPHKNVIVRALGMQADTKVDVQTLTLRQHDVLMLCSDGVHRVVPSFRKLRGDPRSGRRPGCGGATRSGRRRGGRARLASFLLRLVQRRASARRIGAERRPMARSRLSNRTPRQRRSSADLTTSAPRPVLDAIALPRGRVLARGARGRRRAAPRPERRGHRALLRARPSARRLGERRPRARPRPTRKNLGASRGSTSSRAARKPWCDARMTAFAPTFDGSSWLVGDGERIFVIDALDDGWRSLWSTREAGATATQIVARGAAARRGTGATGARVRRRSGSTRIGSSRRRRALEALGCCGGPFSNPGGIVGADFTSNPSAPELIRDTGSGWRRGPVIQPETPLVAWAIDGACSASGLCREGGCEVEIDHGQGQPVIRVLLERAKEVGVRLAEGRALVVDDRGRILHVEADGAVRGWRVAQGRGTDPRSRR